MVREKQKKLGAFYTPSHTVDYMISGLDNLNKESQLLEPSGGDGAFVSAILDKKILEPNQIEVWDINHEIKNNIERLGIKKIIIKDSLVETELNRGTLFEKKYNFTHIIGNPPYLNKQSQYIKNNKGILRNIYSEIGVNDTYAMFIYLSSNLLADRGNLSFIVSDTFLTLGIHKKLRRYLLKNFIIKEITLCPNNLFKEMGALVNTCIISLRNEKPNEGDFIIFNDCRKNDLGNYDGKKHKVNQLKLLSYPDYIFDFNGRGKLIEKIQGSKKMIDFLDGGLGMHTTNNKKYLAIIDYNGRQYGKNGVKNIISIDDVDNKKWRFYHKKGGNKEYYSPVEFAIKWDENSIKNYKSYKKITPYLSKKGFIISGVSSFLSARMAQEESLWESNKAMCFFSKDEKKYPIEFFIGILNSDIYKEMAKLINHTNSLQIRDIKKLPLFDFNKEDVREISSLTKKIINNLKKNENYDYFGEKSEINSILKKYIYA